MTRKKKKRDNSTIEWERKHDNIGVIWTFPGYELQRHLAGKDIIRDIIGLFWDKENKEISLLDFCVLSGLWWNDSGILSARFTLFTHPDHHYSQYTFDKEKERLIIQFRQPDIDGKHWKDNHIHIVRGQIDPKDSCNIINPFLNEHVKLARPIISEVYVMKAK